ncbi:MULTISPECIES: cation:proton antiporter [Pedobacter]|uniref:Sodium/hydrogen exchanger n=1 Tax=Pedobacter heparinus (strain ATCC 13125 / DSM 2366 / CIP 104194 / JCM 7457 / NBRC 12017 / NCIMB 9290 / NRRL B-14731 / HIM 762-3) TaxID=485917 RepID=C6XTG4_PEDHD|nr:MULTISPECIES: cation:proton antiporter [Pedobacter]ACU05742.1 sodium/hydrogen exchanger [Pedobacter heparinus DSM 2366]MBB5440006.1 CPA2 family monovalent cation:H+ antiporter-2 [Pedobacter sp. AK017]
MIHLPVLITDLGLILAAAGITTLLFKRIKQPLVLGYILAGLLVGPHIKFIPTVTDNESIHIWAEIGVIFLLFSLGLEFSFKKLVKVGGSASITAIVEVVFMLLIGFVAGKAMGWATMDSIFLGGILSVSSTTIIIRAFEELGVKHKKFAGLVFGVLIVEDLVAILLLVLLSTLAVSQQFAGAEMLVSILKLCFFLVLWFIGGIFLVPTFLKATKKLMNDETMLVVSIALCLIMVLLAVKVGFSPALGAFIMGSILAETTQAERIEHLTKSVKDLFAAIFFVSVGMLIDPGILVDYAVPILIITLATILGKFLSSGMGALLSGQPLKTSVQTGLSLAQIGEFSFIIATLGVTLKVTSDFLYPIAVAVSAITTFTTPYLIKASEPFYFFLERNLPKKWVEGLNRYSSSTAGITTLSDWKILLKSYTFNTIIHSVILIALVFLGAKYLQPFITGNIINGNKGIIISLVVTLIFMTPFLWALAIRRIERKAYSHLWLNKKYTRGPLIALEILRIALAIFFVGFLIFQFYSTWLAITIAVVLIVSGMVIFSRKLQGFYNRLESRFLLNLNAREAQNAQPEILPWDTHLAELVVAPESKLVGQTLIELSIREKYGVNIALIERGKIMIPTPGRDERLYPNDKVLVIGTDAQLAMIKELFEGSVDEHEEAANFPKKDMTLQKIVINANSPVYGQSIRSSGIRETTQGLVVGIERNGERILNPDSNMVFENEDIVWIVGNNKKVPELLK